MAEAVLGTHDDWQIGKTKIFLKVREALPLPWGRGTGRAATLEQLQRQMGPCWVTGSSALHWAMGRGGGE